MQRLAAWATLVQDHAVFTPCMLRTCSPTLVRGHGGARFARTSMRATPINSNDFVTPLPLLSLLFKNAHNGRCTVRLTGLAIGKRASDHKYRLPFLPCLSESHANASEYSDGEVDDRYHKADRATAPAVHKVACPLPLLCPFAMRGKG